MSGYETPWYGWILQRFLIGTSEVSALCGKVSGVACVYVTDVPAAAVAPFVRLSPLGGSEELGWRAEHLVQVDVFGGTRAANHGLAEAVRFAVRSGFNGTLSYTAGSRSEACVVNGTEIGTVVDDTDESTTPPRPRGRFDIVIYGHPRPA